MTDTLQTTTAISPPAATAPGFKAITVQTAIAGGDRGAAKDAARRQVAADTGCPLEDLRFQGSETVAPAEGGAEAPAMLKTTWHYRAPPAKPAVEPRPAGAE